MTTTVNGNTRSWGGGGGGRTWGTEMLVVGCLVDFLTSSATERLYRGRIPRLTYDNDKFTRCHSRLHYNDTDPASRERATLAGIEPRIRPPHQESRSLPTELPRPRTEMLIDLSQLRMANCKTESGLPYCDGGSDFCLGWATVE